MTENENGNETREMVFVGDPAELGLTGHFNTFQVGSKWADLRPENEVSLIVQGHARRAGVLAVHAGELGDMLELHAGAHHGCRQPMPADRKLELQAILSDVYGRRVQLHERCVVVYLYVPDYEGGS